MAANYLLTSRKQMMLLRETLQEWLTANKGRAEALNFATFGAGTPGHFVVAEFGEQAGMKVEPVHYRSLVKSLSMIVFLGLPIEGKP